MLLPVGVTLGAYAAVANQAIMNAIHGKVPPGAITQIGPDGNPEPGPVITTTMYCQDEAAIGVYPFRYIYNPNVWGDPDKTGALCMSITSNTGSDVHSFYAANFSATWEYPQRTGQPVHAFPNALLNDTHLPMLVSNMQSMVLDVAYSYAPGDVQVAPADTDENALTAAGLNANVALDMFYDKDQATSQDSATASIEVMIWLGMFGNSAQPIGYNGGKGPIAATVTINNTIFNLFWGTNDANQYVLTWLAENNPTDFVGDVSLLITGLSQVAGLPGPTGDYYLGYAAFGSETFYSGTNVTFAVPRLAININGE